MYTCTHTHPYVHITYIDLLLAAHFYFQTGMVENNMKNVPCAMELAAASSSDMHDPRCVDITASGQTPSMAHT